MATDVLEIDGFTEAEEAMNILMCTTDASYPEMQYLIENTRRRLETFPLSAIQHHNYLTDLSLYESQILKMEVQYRCKLLRGYIAGTVGGDPDQLIILASCSVENLQEEQYFGNSSI